MLPKPGRINKNLFDLVMKEGSSVYSPILSLHSISWPQDEPMKSLFAFVVPVKFIKTAVSRNKLKRRGRQIVSKSLTKIKKSYLGIFFFKPEALTLAFKNLEEEMLKLLNRAGLLIR